MLSRLWPLTSTARSTTASLIISPQNLIQKANVHHHKERQDLQRFLGIHRSNKARANRNTHVNEKMFRRERRLAKLPPSQMRMEMLKKGINPYKEVNPRAWKEAQITMQSFCKQFIHYEDLMCQNAVLDPFISPEKSPITSGGIEGIKEQGLLVKDKVLQKWHNWNNGIRRIRKKEGLEKFDVKTFGPTANLIYEEAYKALMKRDKQTLHKYITEHAFGKMWPDVEEGSISWELIEHLEPSKVITIRCADYPHKSGNDIAQITVRMHTKQKLAVYDRFGHLLLGSETEPREVVEYVVFENHIAVVDGTWRLHDKVYPRWSQPKEGAHITHSLGNVLEDSRPSEAEDLPLRIEEKQRENLVMSGITITKKEAPKEVKKTLDDEEFEEFPVQEWVERTDDADDEDVNVWEDNWDDETHESDFSKQLNHCVQNQVQFSREELAKSRHNVA
uniref:26S proteasome complex subunit dss-1 n=1 Tax=Heterorhabditis bacteriophora TaxID=37862 RepID=A0A1I7XS43_HETBA